MKTSVRRGTVRAAVGLGAVGFAVAGALAVAGPAAAHVTVNPGDATAGERARVDFRVPTESETESTVAVEVHFPEDPPISSVSVGKVPGWSAEVAYRELDEPIEGGHGEQITEVVESITWTADDPGAEIQPGEFGEFPVGLGPLPEADQLFFPTLQTYSDDEVVRWIEEPQGDVEPEFPAPSLTLAAAGAPEGEGTAGGGEADTSGDAPADTAADSDSDSDSGAGMWLGLGGLVAGLAGLAVGGVALARSRSGAGSS
ncbi:MAG: DUF1775 domain-containing protein [Micromonosporaceae bacterium]|nr:DUF1775 domain-containing protein [Micromonosporaceae bacterium]